MGDNEYQDLISRLINKEVNLNDLPGFAFYELLEEAQCRFRNEDQQSLKEDIEYLTETLAKAKDAKKQAEDRNCLLHQKINSIRNKAGVYNRPATKAKLIESLQEIEKLL